MKYTIFNYGLKKIGEELKRSIFLPLIHQLLQDLPFAFVVIINYYRRVYFNVLPDHYVITQSVSRLEELVNVVREFSL